MKTLSELEYELAKSMSALMFSGPATKSPWIAGDKGSSISRDERRKRTRARKAAKANRRKR